MWVRHGTWSMPCQQARDTRHKLPSPDLPVDKEYQAPDELRKLAARETSNNTKLQANKDKPQALSCHHHDGNICHSLPVDGQLDSAKVNGINFICNYDMMMG
ncbi:hypothetical protein ACLKA6_007822 [Drosophila palustris]